MNGALAVADPTLDWGVAALEARLGASLPGVGIEVVASLGSTNAVLLERCRERGRAGGGAACGTGAAGPVLLVAERQTEGRGRQGRRWASAAAPGASLTFSLALGIARADWSGLSLAVGVAVAEALDPPGTGRPAAIGLKWPNDLWRLEPGSAGGAGRKLGGILIESVVAGGGSPAGGGRIAVIGIGLNVRRFDPAAVGTGFASLDELDPAATAPGVLARVAPAVGAALRAFERDGFAAFADGFAARDLLRGRPVTTTADAAPDGIARGVGIDGTLRIELEDGRTVAIASGEVSVRPTAGSKTGSAR